jgi:hypothetical protein
MTVLAMTAFTWVFIGIPLLIVWAIGIVDIVRRDMPNGTKAVWILVVLVFPVIGTITYFVLRKPTGADVRRSREASADLNRQWPGSSKR